MVPEVNPVCGRVLSDKWMRARQEKVSRVVEIELGHNQVRGKWSASVEKALRAEGHHELADKVKPLTDGDDPREAYTSTQHQIVERRGLSMPDMKAAVVTAWQRADSGAAFLAALAEQELAVRRGDRNGTWIVEARDADGAPVLLGAVHRLAGVKKAEAGNRLAEFPSASTDPDPLCDRPAAVPVPELAHAVAENKSVPEEPTSAPPPVVADKSTTAIPDATSWAPIHVVPIKATISTADGAAPTPGRAGAEDGAARARTDRRPSHRTPGGGGASAVADGNGGDDFIAPIDPSKPDDYARFLMQWSAAEQKRRARTAAAERTSKQHGWTRHDTEGEIRDLTDAIREWIDECRRRYGGERAVEAERHVRAAFGEAADLERQQGQRPDRRYRWRTEGSSACCGRGIPGGWTRRRSRPCAPRSCRTT